MVYTDRNLVHNVQTFDPVALIDRLENNDVDDFHLTLMSDNNTYDYSGYFCLYERNVVD